jgi:hypothetical protein
MRYTARQLKTAGRNKKTEHLVCSKPGWCDESAEIDPLVFSSLITRKEYREAQAELNSRSKRFVDNMNLPDSVKASRQREYNLRVSRAIEAAALRSSH